MKNIAKIIIIATGVALGVYSVVLRFKNPALTETQIFFKMIGLD